MGKAEIDDKTKELAVLLDVEIGERYGSACDEFDALAAKIIPEITALRAKFADAHAIAGKSIAIRTWCREPGDGAPRVDPDNHAGICESAVKNLTAVINNLRLPRS